MKKMEQMRVTMDIICSADNLVIYGAGTMGKALKKCLTEPPYNLSVDGFIVKSMEDNPNMVSGLPVTDIAHASKYKSAYILIALNGKYIPEVIQDLKAEGFEHLIPISFDGDDWTYIRSNWMQANHILPDRVKLLSDLARTQTDNMRVHTNDLSLHLYVAHSIYDRELSWTPPEQRYEIPIQVGAALADRKMYEVTDFVGDDSISEKNRQFCELTGIYWAWKNDKSDYIGFCHYRRKFDLSEEEINCLLNGRVDIVVTQPIINFDSVKKQYAKDHCVSDWEDLVKAIHQYAPEYDEAVDHVQNDIYYYAYNMFIMKREIFDLYCKFIFPILQHCEQSIGTKEDVYQNRYVGFLAERLLSVFIEKNQQYSVAIADKYFIE